MKQKNPTLDSQLTINFRGSNVVSSNSPFEKNNSTCKVINFQEHTNSKKIELIESFNALSDHLI